MDRTRITGEYRHRAGSPARADAASRTGVSPRTAAEGQAPTVGRGALHGHG
ncbi:hypothetical protein [Streptomyces sp. NPDC054952]